MSVVSVIRALDFGYVSCTEPVFSWPTITVVPGVVVEIAIPVLEAIVVLISPWFDGLIDIQECSTESSKADAR